MENVCFEEVEEAPVAVVVPGEEDGGGDWVE